METDYRFNRATRDFFGMSHPAEEGCDTTDCELSPWKMRLIKWLLPIASKEIARQAKVIRLLQLVNHRLGKSNDRLRDEIKDLKWQAEQRKKFT